MSSITYNLDIPDAPNNPSVDQPKMKVNTNATSSIMAVDHYTFAESNAGTHRQVNFPNANAAGTQTGAQLTIYTAPGTASSASSQVFWKNSNGGGAAVPYLLGAIKAWGTYSAASSNVTYTYGAGQIPQSSNIVSVAIDSNWLATITMSANTVVAANYAVIATVTGTTVPVIVMTKNLGVSSFQLQVILPYTSVYSPVAAQAVSFIVLQI